MRKALVSAAGPRMLPVLELSAETFRRFAARHSYDLLLDRSLDDEGPSDPRGRRRARWHKIDLIADALNDHDVVMWIDADAMFCRFDRDIVDDLPDDCLQGLVLEQWPTRFNPQTGVWALRREPEARAFLDEVRSIGQLDHSWADQAAVCVALGWSVGDFHGHGARPVRPSRFLARTGWLPPEWNPLGLASRWPARVRHFAHMEPATRIERMRRELARLEARGDGASAKSLPSHQRRPSSTQR